MCNNNNNNTNQVTVISTPQFIHKLANFMHIITMHSSGAGAVKLQFYSHHTIRFRFRPDMSADIRPHLFTAGLKECESGASLNTITLDCIVCFTNRCYFIPKLQLQVGSLSQAIRAAACLSLGQNMTAKIVHLTLLYPWALTSTNDHLSVLRHYVCT